VQEDRRSLEEIRSQVPYLRRLIVSDTRIVEADVDHSALRESDVVWKLVEASDVASTLTTANKSLEVRYPAWMVCAHGTS
jgi:hypothetical protein